MHAKKKKKLVITVENTVISICANCRFIFRVASARPKLRLGNFTTARDGTEQTAWTEQTMTYGAVHLPLQAFPYFRVLVIQFALGTESLLKLVGNFYSQGTPTQSTKTTKKSDTKKFEHGSQNAEEFQFDFHKGKQILKPKKTKKALQIKITNN